MYDFIHIAFLFNTCDSVRLYNTIQLFIDLSLCAHVNVDGCNNVKTAGFNG
jgi:hypothetical protein